MTEYDIVTLGLFCESLQGQESWQTLRRLFEAQTFQHFMSTKASDTKMREDMYASLNGVADFIGIMDTLISQKNEILRKSEEAPSDDALEQRDI